jgi:hypothetical protein
MKESHVGLKLIAVRHKWIEADNINPDFNYTGDEGYPLLISAG